MNGITYRELLLERQGSGFTEREVRDLLSEVLPQLMRLHQQGIAHGGVSLDTVVQDLASHYTRLIAAQPLTDSSYIAPECLQTGQATPTGDVYGLGVTLLTLLSGHSPSVLQPSPGIWNWRAYCSVSSPLAILIDQAIALHPQLRYADAMQMLQALQTLPEITASSVPTADPPAPQTLPQDSSPTVVPSSATIPVGRPPVVASPMADRSLPWPWIVLGIGSLVLLSLVSFAAARFLKPIRDPVTTSPTDSASELPSPDPENTVAPSSSPAPNPDNPFMQESFPQATCGDAMPTERVAFPIEFHPVFVPDRGRNLRRIQAQFCQDALSVTRKDTAEKAIQVASFTSLERAEQFQQFLADQFRNAEIGQATTYDRPQDPSDAGSPDAGLPDAGLPDADSPDAGSPEPELPEPELPEPESESAPSINTDRVTFAPGATGMNLGGEVAADQIQRYLINCGQAQRFILRIENGNVEAAVISPDGATLGSAVKEGSQWEGILPSTGDYTLEVAPLERDSNYRISIEVL